MPIVRLSGTGFPTAYTKRRRAIFYLATAIELRRLAYRRGRTPAFGYVRLFLRGRWLELSLKAFLLLRGWTGAQVKSQLRHNLQRCLDAAVREGLNIQPPTPEAVEQLAAFDRHYRDKRFEYFSTFELLAPVTARSYRALWQLADRAHQEVLKQFLA
jgi:hypothetical protein